MSTKIGGVSKNHKILKILCFSLIFSALATTPLLISSCSKKTPQTPNPTEYIGNMDGTNWKGHESGSLTCTPNGDERAAITYAHGYAAHDLVIPWKVRDNDGIIYEVTEIIGAFEEYDNDKILTGTLTLPDTLISLLPYSVDGAFDSCTGLTKINFGKHLKTIGAAAFYECTGLTADLIIPDSVETVGNAAFMKCSGLRGSLMIPDSVEEIGASAFWNCSGLNGTLTIPNSVNEARVLAFAWTSFNEINLESWNSLPTWNGENCFQMSSSHGTVLLNSTSSENFKTSVMEKLYELGLPEGWTHN